MEIIAAILLFLIAFASVVLSALVCDNKKKHKNISLKKEMRDYCIIAMVVFVFAHLQEKYLPNYTYILFAEYGTFIVISEIIILAILCIAIAKRTLIEVSKVGDEVIDCVKCIGSAWKENNMNEKVLVAMASGAVNTYYGIKDICNGIVETLSMKDINKWCDDHSRKDSYVILQKEYISIKKTKIVCTVYDEVSNKPIKSAYWECTDIDYEMEQVLISKNSVVRFYN